MHTLDIIIVNWNSWELLCECIKSVAMADQDGFKLNRVVIIDNASEDSFSIDSLYYLKLPLTVIQNKKNMGFAAACNQGAKGSSADYLLFLNPDTCLFKDSLVKPLAFMGQAENCKIGIVGIQLIDEMNCVVSTCARFPTTAMFFSKMLGLDKLSPHYFPSHFMRDWDHGKTCEVDQVMGAFFMIRRQLFETMDGFDERFFVYFEEVDLSYRVYNSGWKTVYLANAQVYHKGGGASEKVKSARLFYSLHSRILYGYKHFSWFSATLLMAGTIFISPFAG
jgi:N-acetylglucosaminyl-diphospho-decaprenol L-rhamnosyltransferase